MNKEFCLRCGNPAVNKQRFHYKSEGDEEMVDAIWHICTRADCKFQWESHVTGVHSWLLVIDYGENWLFESNVFWMSPVGCLAVYQWEPV